MATIKKTKRPRGYVGELDGNIITKKIWLQQTKAVPQVNEFLEFVKLLNRGGI